MDLKFKTIKLSHLAATLAVRGQFRFRGDTEEDSPNQEKKRESELPPKKKITKVLKTESKIKKKAKKSL